MSNGRLKASTNRVRTSVAMHQTSIWTSAIGVEKHENTNSVIEATLNAPGMGTGKRGEARRAAAAAAIQATDGFGGGGVNSYQGLMDLARQQGALGGLNRGACKKCGQLGHLTKQCRNQFSRFFDGGPGAEKDAAQQAAAAAGVPTAAIAMAPLAADAAGDGPTHSGESSDSLLEELGAKADAGSDSGSSSSSSDSEAERRRHKEKERSRKRKERKEKEKKRRKEKRARKEAKASKCSSGGGKHKKRRSSPSSSSD